MACFPWWHGSASWPRRIWLPHPDQALRATGFGDTLNGMRGADHLIDLLSHGGIDIMFANPGTSEMQVVDALDAHSGIRGILGLHETVCTGAADGYGRVSGKAASVLLHLGPGLANGLANMHNAHKAQTPMVVVVGDHPADHRALNPPLASDIEAIAKGASSWVGTAENADDLVHKTAQAMTIAHQAPGHVVTLVVPNDAAWSPGTTIPPAVQFAPPERASDADLKAAEKALFAGASAMLLGGNALTEDGLEAAGRVADATGAKIFCETFNRRVPRGAGLVEAERLPYFPAQVIQTLSAFENLVLIGAAEPVSFFAYNGVPSQLVPAGCQVHTLGAQNHDHSENLRGLARRTGGRARPMPQQAEPVAPKGILNAAAVGQSLARHIKDGDIISDDATTAGLDCWSATRACAPHDWLFLTGGAIGQGMPVAAGAALARPNAQVFCLSGDGAGAYSPQALWTMAREGLDVITIVFANRKYRILEMEMMMARGSNDGASSLFDLSPPSIDWVKLAESFGVTAARVETATAFEDTLTDMLKANGPRLIEAIVP